MLPNTQQGGVTSFRAGSLKRKLKPITLLNLDALVAPSSFTGTRLLLLKNLNNSLWIHVMCGVVGPDGSPVRPVQYPATPGTMQLTPISNNPEAPKLWLRPVFQDPAASPVVDTPLPREIPYGWEGSTNADEIEIEIVLTNAFAATGLAGRLMVQVTVEYKGIWWDTEAIRFALSMPTLEGDPNPAKQGTRSE